MKRVLILFLILELIFTFELGVIEAATTNLSLTIKDNPLSFIAGKNMIMDVQEFGIDWDVSLNIINGEQGTIFVLTIF